MAVCVITQPRFFPGLHYLHRMMLADLFVILDTVQFSPRHEENRTKVKAPDGPRWLTVPVRQSHREQRIIETTLDDTQPWRRKAIRTLETLYGRAPCYATYAAEVISILESPYGTLADLDCASWAPALRSLGINCRFICASTLPVSGSGSQLLFNICRWLRADVYLSGAFGRDYLDLAAFESEGVSVCFHEYSYPPYPQCFGPFVPWLSYLDMLFNAGLDRHAVAVGGTVHTAAAQGYSGAGWAVPERVAEGTA